MARRGRERERRRRRGIFGRFTRELEGFELEPETRKNVVALVFFLLGIVSILSLFHAAGRVGEWLRPQIFSVFGWGAYVLPFLVTAASLARLDPDRFGFSRGRYLGFFLLVLSGHGLLHLIAPAEESLVLVDQGRGGGYLGWLVSYWLRQGVGDVATWAFLVVVFLIALIMVTNRTPGELLQRLRERRALAQRMSRDAQEAGPPETSEGEEEPAGAGEPLEEMEEQRTLPVFATRLLDSVKVHQSAPDGRQAPPTPRRGFGLPYERPPLALLSDATTRPTSGDVAETQRVIQKTLETFGIPVTMGDVNVGPTVTQYTLKPEEGVKLAKITALHNDLALALSAHPIRIEAPIPGKALVGIEVPNKSVSIVRLREILQHEIFRRSSSPLTFAIGKDVMGHPVVADLDRMPHLLIAGATGSGKSVMINNLIMSFLYRNSPAVVRLLLIDPKRVELALYNGIPHLLAPVVTEPEKAINALRWAVGEMDRRYSLLSETRKRDVTSYNAGRRGGDLLPYIVVVIDELADIMARYGREVEGAIVRLAQMARAVGLHLIVSTQRPSVDVITGLIKANITSRIAFNVASLVDSRTILDSAGAEKLLGNGDMLFLRGDVSRPRRVQAAYVSEDEVKKVSQFLGQRGEAVYDAGITVAQQSLPSAEIRGETEGEVDDALLEEAERVVREASRASTSLLQRRLRIGYSRAARIIDILEERGVVGPADGSRPREVLAQNDPSFPSRLLPRRFDDAGGPTPQTSFTDVSDSAHSSPIRPGTSGGQESAEDDDLGNRGDEDASYRRP